MITEQGKLLDAIKTKADELCRDISKLQDVLLLNDGYNNNVEFIELGKAVRKMKTNRLYVSKLARLGILHPISVCGACYLPLHEVNIQLEKRGLETIS